MTTNRRKKIISVIITALFLWFFCTTAIAEEEREKGYYIVYEENTNKKIFSTARVVHLGDQYLNEENILYEIVKISGDKAYAKFKEKVDIQKALDLPESQAVAQALEDESVTLEASGTEKEKVIAIYHTHSDESYIPTDGKASIPHSGGIYKVGAALKAALEEKGIKAIQSEKSHDPHDSMAYQRSRRTAAELLKKAPDAIIDVHRDAVPAEEYHGNVNGKTLAKMQLVVGRQNPQMEATDNFAKQLKATADKKYPGLIKGIFYGKGAYNQDIYPRSILIEAGTYTNSRFKAQEGANIMADVIATTIYGEDYEKESAPGKGATTKIPGEGGGTSRALLWILGIAALGFGAYMFISTGGINELAAKVKRFSSREFANFLGTRQSTSSENKEESDREEHKDEL
ncbi:MAG: stage II sporulation protein P [Thermoanaerobacteraceae bacterium]|nr:stage II sporulation protein P [Thermoanaerobacteraceae bacterium]